MAHEFLDGTRVLELPPFAIGGWKKHSSAPAEVREIPLPDRIVTKHYAVRIDPKNAALSSIKLRASGREMLAGPANVIVAEKPRVQKGDPGDFIVARPQRERLDSSSEYEQTARVRQGPLAMIVEVEGQFFGNGLCRRTITLYHDYPRIDFITELNDLPNLTVVVAEFPLAGDITEVRRGIPYGFSHGAWNKPNPDLPGWTKGIVPAVRWSHYAFADGGGAAILDRGLTGRELNGNTPIIYLYNATDEYYGYPNPWLSGKGRHILHYALVCHEGGWRGARIPQMAWEYNCQPLVFMNRAANAAKPVLRTSGNVIVESMRRTGNEIELRLAECLGFAGTAEVTLSLPHKYAAKTDMNGDHAKSLPGGPKYLFPVRPQEIVTLRFGTSSQVVEAELVTKWDAMVPPAKLPMLHRYSSEKGHPPRGS